MGMTQEQYISHKIGQSLGQKEEKEWRQAKQRAAKEKRVWEEEEEVAKKAQAAVETTALHAAIAEMLAKKAKVLELKVEPEEHHFPFAFPPLPELDRFHTVDGV
jgi:ATPase subunit of ABC transporter with duplicated ATPase domains